MKIRLLPSLFYLAPLLFMFSCGSVKEPDFKSVENIRISRFGLSESTLNLDLHYFNPNGSGLKMKNAEGDAWIDNNYLGHFTIDTLINIPARGDFRLPVKLKVDMSKILKNSLLAFLSKEVLVKIGGTARVGKGFVYINYPIRYEGKQDLGELMK